MGEDILEIEIHGRDEDPLAFVDTAGNILCFLFFVFIFVFFNRLFFKLALRWVTSTDYRH